MTATWVTIPELDAALKLSMVSVPRVYWKEPLPVIHIGRMLRFDLEKMGEAIQHNSYSTVMTLDPSERRGRRTPGGASRRRGSPAPPLSQTGAQIPSNKS